MKVRGSDIIGQTPPSRPAPEPDETLGIVAENDVTLTRESSAPQPVAGR